MSTEGSLVPSNYTNIETELSEKQIEAQLHKGKAYFLAAIIAMGGYSIGYYISIFNPLGEPLAEHVYGLNKQTNPSKDGFIGNLNLFFTLGAFFSVLFSATICRWIGRIRMLIILELVAMAAIAGYMVKDINILYICRFLSGIVGGANGCVTYIATKEMMPAKVAGFGGLFLYFCLTSCILSAWGWGFLGGSTGTIGE